MYIEVGQCVGNEVVVYLGKSDRTFLLSVFCQMIKGGIRVKGTEMRVGRMVNEGQEGTSIKVDIPQSNMRQGNVILFNVAEDKGNEKYEPLIPDVTRPAA